MNGGKNKNNEDKKPEENPALQNGASSPILQENPSSDPSVDKTPCLQPVRKKSFDNISEKRASFQWFIPEEVARQITSRQEEIAVSEEDSGIPSTALIPGTVVDRKYEILKVKKYKENGSTYLVKDIKVTEKNFILKEIIPPPMTKEEYLERFDKFLSAIEIIRNMQNPSLVELKEGFSWNNRIFYVEEYTNGLDMEELLEVNKEPFNQSDVINIGFVLLEIGKSFPGGFSSLIFRDLKPGHLLLTPEGILKIAHFNMRIFFDRNFSPSYPETIGPEERYGDITALCRLLYFYITRQCWMESTAPLKDIKISEKMKGLLIAGCREGQRFIGSLTTFENDLESALEDIPEEPRFPPEQKEKEPLPKNSFFQAIFSQRPYILIMEIIFLIFLAVLFFHHRGMSKTYVRPPGEPLLYISSREHLLTVRKNFYNIIDSRIMPGTPVNMLCTWTLVKKPDGEKGMERKKVLLASLRDTSSVLMIDTDTNQILKNIKVDRSPCLLMTEPETQRVFIAHNRSPRILILNMRNQEIEGILDGAEKPADMAYIPLSHELMEIRRKKLEERQEISKIPSEDEMILSPDDGEMFLKPDQASPLVVISVPENKSLVFINPDTGKTVRTLKLDGKPGKMALSPDYSFLYLLDTQHGRIWIVDLADKRVTRTIEQIGGQEPSDIVMDGVRNTLWISLRDKNTLISYDLDQDRPAKKIPVGEKPDTLLFDAPNSLIWVLHLGQREVEIFNTALEQVHRQVTLPYIPESIVPEN